MFKRNKKKINRVKKSTNSTNNDPKEKKVVTKKKVEKKNNQITISWILIILFLGYLGYRSYYYENEKNIYSIVVQNQGRVSDKVYPPLEHLWIVEKILPEFAQIISYKVEKRVSNLEWNQPLPSADIYGDLAYAFFVQQLARNGALSPVSSMLEEPSEKTRFLKPSFHLYVNAFIEYQIKTDAIPYLYEEGVLPEDLDIRLQEEENNLKTIFLSHFGNIDWSEKNSLKPFAWDNLLLEVNEALDYIKVTRFSPAKIEYPDMELYNIIRERSLNPPSLGKNDSHWASYYDLGRLLTEYPSLNTPLIIDSLLSKIE